MTRTLLIGGAGFFGQHAVDACLARGDAVAVLGRNEPEPPLPEAATVLRGDRHDRGTVVEARNRFEPDVVIDLAARRPDAVEAAVEVFAAVDAYVYVSSASAYELPHGLPSREDDPLEACSPEQATDGSMASYGARKAEGDRVCFAAADDGVNASVVRPVVGYGPGDWSGRHYYWFDRIRRFDRILVPGDGSATFHRVFGPDVGEACRLVAERGEPGEAYNVAERDTAWLGRTISVAADALGTEVETVHASPRELASAGLEPGDFPLYAPFPLLVATEKLAGLGWDSAPVETAIGEAVGAFLDRGATVPDPPTRPRRGPGGRGRAHRGPGELGRTARRRSEGPGRPTPTGLC